MKRSAARARTGVGRRVERVAEPHVRVVVRVHVALRRRRARRLLGRLGARRLALRRLGVLLQLVDLVRRVAVRVAVLRAVARQQLQLGGRAGPRQVLGRVVARHRPAAPEAAHEHGAQRRAVHGVEGQGAVVRRLHVGRQVVLRRGRRRRALRLGRRLLAFLLHLKVSIVIVLKPYDWMARTLGCCCELWGKLTSSSGL